MRGAGHIDETAYNALLQEMELMSAKDFSKWNWEGLLDVVEGLGPKLDDTLKLYKFLKKALFYFKPSSSLYSELTNIKSHALITKTAFTLIKTLLKTKEGVKALEESFLFQELGELVSNMDYIDSSADNFFSSERLDHTVVRYYFNMIGIVLDDVAGKK